MSVDEIKAGDKVLLRVQDDASTVIIKAPGHGGAEKFHFDHAFSEAASQEEVYKRSAKPIVDNVLRGMNCCMFAYGQTGTGV
jgi:Kinesin motor domain